MMLSLLVSVGVGTTGTDTLVDLTEPSPLIGILADEQGRPSLLFEIKTSDQWQYIYTAVGQLLIHKSQMRPSTRCILVAPNSKQNRWVPTVRQLGIETITYTMRDGTPSFDRNATSVFKR